MRKRNRANLSVTFVVVLLIVTFLAYFEPRVVAVEQENSDSWPMFHHDLQRTGYSTSISPDTNGTKWIYNSTSEIVSSPAVVNGRVIVGSSNGDVFALNAASGERMWFFSTGAGQDAIWSSPAVDSGRVFIGTRDNKLYCLNETTGALLWNFLTGNDVDSSPAVYGGRVFFCSNDEKMYCLNAETGALVWSITLGNASSPAIVNGTVYVASVNQIQAINASNGAKIWNLNVTGTMAMSPCIGDGKLFFASVSGKVCGFDIVTSMLLWNQTVPAGVFRSSPAVSGYKLYLCSNDTVVCIDGRTGMLLWSHTPSSGSYIWSSPCVADGKVFVGSSDSKLYCFDELTGRIIWSCLTLERIVSSPVVCDGIVFVGCGGSNVGGRVYAFGATVIREFSIWTMLPAFVLISLFVMTIKKKNRASHDSAGFCVLGLHE